MSILTDIIDWVESKPLFWQVAIDRLIRNNHLSSDDLDLLKKLCKYEVGLVLGDFEGVDFSYLRDFANNLSGNDAISLTKIYNIENINALSTENILEFSPKNLTVVYGDNGAGKSSYISILKHICHSRGEKPLIVDNLFVSSKGKKNRKAAVEYQGNNQVRDSIILENDNISSPILKGVEVFDTKSANHYIEKEDEVAFLPEGLAVLEKFAECLGPIEKDLLEEIKILELKKFDVSLLNISEGSKAQKFLENLNHKTRVEELKTGFQFTETKESHFVKLKTEIQEIKVRDPKFIIRKNEDKILRLGILQNKLKEIENTLFGESLETIKRTINKYITSIETLEAASDKIFSGLPIEGIGNETWKRLWESARAFYNNSKGEEIFPDILPESNCPLCLQELGDIAKKRFLSFEDFVKKDTQLEFDKSLDDYNRLFEKTRMISLIFDEQEAVLMELEKDIEGYSTIFSNITQAFNNQKENIIEKFKNKKRVTNIGIQDFDRSAITKIRDLIEKIRNDNENLQDQQIDKIIQPLEREYNIYREAKIIERQSDKLEMEILRLGKIELLKECCSKCKTRNVTLFSNQMASTYISDKLKNNFQKELSRLGFVNIKIETETKGIKGKQYHYLRLNEQNVNKVALKDILSEGEHRCIALATFFSELTLANHNSSIIFDDPVSSLDHKWRNRIAKRIVEESESRQVIVFTHDITFLLMLEENTRKKNVPMEIKSLTRKKTETGLIAKNPPWDALSVKKRIGVLKNDSQELNKIERTETEELYKKRVKEFYGNLRETWERFIEEILLNNVIQRFGREIQTQRLKVLHDLSMDDCSIVEKNMKKCSTYFAGHDSSGSLIEEMPNSLEVSEDLNILENYLKEMRSRGRK